MRWKTRALRSGTLPRSDRRRLALTADAARVPRANCAHLSRPDRSRRRRAPLHLGGCARAGAAARGRVAAEQGRRNPHGRGADRLLARDVAGLQGAGRGGVRRAAEDVDRQGQEVRAARARSVVVTMAAPRHIARSRVAWIDTDAGGRIHFTAAFRWAESGETALLRSLGLLDDW